MRRCCGRSSIVPSRVSASAITNCSYQRVPTCSYQDTPTCSTSACQPAPTSALPGRRLAAFSWPSAGGLLFAPIDERSLKKGSLVMKAILITVYGGPEVLSVTELPDPVPAAGEVLIRVRAFGLNHAETYMRSGAWGKVAQVTGIECAGTVQADPNGRLAAGTPVIAILGGMGRTRNGSYAELVTVPAGNVVPVSTSLSWTDLVALPEVYATAWAGLHQNLGLRPGQTVLVRAATSPLGQASVEVVRSGGAVWPLGFRGGLGAVAGFGPIADLPAGVQLSFYGSAFVLGTEGFPLADIPLQEMISKAEAGRYQAKPVKVFGFGEIVEAHRAMERGLAGGKMVVAVN